MRVTPGMMMSSMLHNIEQNQVRTEQLQNQITSGSRITKPSDDPIGAARALNLQESLDQSDQYVRNIDQATSWLNTTDSVLDAVTQALQRARELGVEGASETLSPSDRNAIASEIGQLQQHVLDLASSKYGPYFIFAGTDSDAPGYVTAASTNTTPGAYQGNDAQVMRPVAQGTSMSVNTDARATFDPVFEALETLKTGLTTNNTPAVQTSLMQFDAALDAVSMSRAQIGAKVNRLDFLKTRQLDIGVNLTSLLSEVKDVDMAEAITSFSMAQNVYTASLKAGAQAMQPSLLDYLR
jgi:flagellar hook-associated protein 3 FlgL